MSGWIKLHRSVLEHWTAKGKASRLHAWIWLLLKANHELGRQPLHTGEVVTIERGQTMTSMLEMSGQWKWDRKTVKSFLLALKNDQQIGLKITQHYTLVTICNYEEYQGKTEEAGQQTGQPVGQSTAQPTSQQTPQQTPHKQEDKEDKEDKNKKARTALDPIPFEDFPSHLKSAAVMQEYASWVELRKKKRAPITRRVQDALFRDFPTSDGLAAALKQSNEKGWTGVFAVKAEKPDYSQPFTYEPFPLPLRKQA